MGGITLKSQNPVNTFSSTELYNKQYYSFVENDLITSDSSVIIYNAPHAQSSDVKSKKIVSNYSYLPLSFNNSPYLFIFVLWDYFMYEREHLVITLPTQSDQEYLFSTLPPLS